MFNSHCLGVKSDLSLEFDVIVGAWTSINDITGRNYAIGLGTDTAEFLNEYGNDETGGNFKLVYNADKVPLIYYVSTFTALNLILLPNFSQKLGGFFCQKKRMSFSTLHFDKIFML